MRGVRPPFDPAEVTHSYAGLLQDYRIKQVTGDNYAAEWVTATFKDAGIKFVRSEYSKSELYLEAFPLFTRGLIAIPDLPPLLKELRLLERQTHRSGKDTVDHGKRGSDDLANCTVRMCRALREKGQLPVRPRLGAWWGVTAGQGIAP